MIWEEELTKAREIVDRDFEEAGRRCGRAIESILKHVYSEDLPILDGPDRLNVLKEEINQAEPAPRPPSPPSPTWPGGSATAGCGCPKPATPAATSA